jgi:FixJ family two-component response regulator
LAEIVMDQLELRLAKCRAVARAELMRHAFDRRAMVHLQFVASQHLPNRTVVLEAKTRLAELTPRQREIMELVVAGSPNKIIAANLRISQRTVESHRASIMKKTGANSLPALTRLALLIDGAGAQELLALTPIQHRPRRK